MKTDSSAGRRMIEALYDVGSGKTYVRHPEREDEWLEVDLLHAVLKGHPMATSSGNDACEVFSSMPHGHKKVAPKKSMLMLTHKGHHSELDL